MKAYFGLKSTHSTFNDFKETVPSKETTVRHKKVCSFSFGSPFLHLTLSMEDL